MNKKMFARLAALAATATATVAHAAIDVSATVTELGEVKTAVVSIGAVVLTIYVGIKLYKWIKAAL